MILSELYDPFDLNESSNLNYLTHLKNEQLELAHLNDEIASQKDSYVYYYILMANKTYVRHCVKKVYIQRYSGPHFPACRLNSSNAGEYGPE